MFEPTDQPRIFGLPAGVDFPAALIQGLKTRLAATPPHEIANVQLIVNTQRMARRISGIFDHGPAGFLPNIQLLTQLEQAEPEFEMPPHVSPLRRRFELIQLISQLLTREPDLASRASLYDLADSLAGLIDEMSGEGVSPDVIGNLDVSDQSGHWERAQKFFGIVNHFLDDASAAPDAETRQRLFVQHLVDKWQHTPPQHPVILAGSTGSRGTTMLLMRAISKLPQGAIILPGYDFDMPNAVWTTLSDAGALQGGDHPQFRFARVRKELRISPDEIAKWHDSPPPVPARNRLISLALRPAPVTDQWLSEGKHFSDIDQATNQITLIEAASVRDEALAIAMRLRKAAEEGQVAALISPDRMLTRQVSAALDQWDILPDDSAGTPLQLTPPGRFLRHVAGLFQHRLTAEALLTLLKHPLTHSGQDRGDHLRQTRELELHLRKCGTTYPEPDFLHAWSSVMKQDVEGWVNWLIECFCDQRREGEHDVQSQLEHHITLAERISAGSADQIGGLWEEAAGRKARDVVDQLTENAPYAGSMSTADYADIFGAVLSQAELRDRDAPHPNILIWGTLEARVQGADMVILGGLNEGSWPESPQPDPWLNRQMRDKAGLLLPERRIGLAAHDFQLAIAAKEVWVTRSKRSDDAETVPSRWVNRLSNLLEGLPNQGGSLALAAMRQRGDAWLQKVALLESVTPVDPAIRPSPRPPSAMRPHKLSVTEIKRLIRDPYAIYARHVLRLRPLAPLMKTPDALLRGIVVHEVIEKFVREVSNDRQLLTQDHLLDIARDVLRKDVPWLTARALWTARRERASGHFLAGEAMRQNRARPVAHERGGEVTIPDLDFKLTAKADRIDRDADGHLHLYDYKTGTPPSPTEQSHFDKQLLLEAAMAERGGFKDIAPAHVVEAIYLGLANNPKDSSAPLAETPADQVWEDFKTLIGRYLDDDQGFTARRALRKDTDISDYDQLSRFGEWDVTDEPVSETLT